VRIEKLQQNFDVKTRFVHFPLHPETPQEGRTLEALFGCGAAEVEQKNANMSGLMQAEGLPYSKRTHTYNSRLAQELGSWASEQPGGEAIHDLLFRAYFVDNRNVGDADVLLDVAETAGLDRQTAATVLDDRTHKQAVDDDWALSRRYGVTGVPTYVAGGTGVVGAQPYEVLERLLTEAGVERRGG